MPEIRDGCSKNIPSKHCGIVHIKNYHLFRKINSLMKQIKIFDLKFNKKKSVFLKHSKNIFNEGFYKSIRKEV